MFYNKSVEQTIKELRSNKENGLTNSEVVKSRQLHGKNVITPSKKKSIFRRILDALTEPMLIILSFAWVITLGVNIGKAISGNGGNFYECIGIFVAIAISVSLTVIMEGRSNKAFEVLSSLEKSSVVMVKRNGKIDYVPQGEIVVGDIIYFEAGDKIVADARIIEALSLKVDESTLTGESKAVTKSAQQLDSVVALAERNNCVFSGTFVTAGSGYAVVTAVGDNAEIGNLAKDLKGGSMLSAPLNEKLSRLGKMVSIFGAVSALIVFAFSLVRLIANGGVNFFSVQNLIIEAIVLIVAAVPEGLPATMAISLTLNVVKLAKSNALIRKLVATETVGCVSVICSDKTGTLTENKMSVEKIEPSIDRRDIKDFIKLNIALNSTAEITADNVQKGSQTEVALLAWLSSEGESYLKHRKRYAILDRIPFSSDKKYMTTEINYEGKRLTLIKGAPERIFELLGGENKYVAHKEKIKNYQSKTLRVIAFMHVIDGEKFFDGFAVLDDKLRPDVISAVSNCKIAGIKVKMLTGDNAVTARAIAEKTGIIDFGCVVTGDVIDKMSDEELVEKIDSIAVVARSTPSTKLRVVKALQKRGEVVAVTGDGVNDAPAVKHADIGISMGNGSEITKEASDIILLDNSFSTIIEAISFGRNVFQNFQRFIMFQLTVNVSSICIIFVYLFMGLESPFTSMGLLWLNVIMDGPLALSLGLEKQKTNFLEQKPVKRSDNILSKKIIARIVIHGIFVAGIVALEELYGFLGASVTQKRTVIFSLFVIFQLFNAINCRHVRADSALKDVFGNKLLLVVGVITFLLQIIITQFMPSVFQTVKLEPVLWVKITLTCSTIILFSEGYKAVYRLFLKRRAKSQMENGLYESKNNNYRQRMQ